MEMVVGVVVLSLSAVLWMCDRWWVMVLAGSMVKIKGKGMLSFFFSMFFFLFLIAHIFLSLVNCFFNFPSECFNFFSRFLFLIFIHFFPSRFSLLLFFTPFFPLKYLLSLSLFPPIFLKSLPFFVMEPFYLYPSHFLSFFYLLKPSLIFCSFLCFFFQPYPLVVRARVCYVHISPMSLQFYYARQTFFFIDFLFMIF